MAKKYTEAQRNLVNEIRRLDKNLSRRLFNIHERYADNEIAMNIYDRYKRQLDNVYYKTINDNGNEVRVKIKISPDTSIADLKTIRKNIVRLEQKQSTYVRDFSQYSNIIDKCVDNGLSVDWAFELYDNLVEEGLLLKNYKYEVVDTIVDFAISGMSDDEIRLRVKNIYDMMSPNDSFKDALNDYEEQYEKFYDYTSL